MSFTLNSPRHEKQIGTHKDTGNNSNILQHTGCTPVKGPQPRSTTDNPILGCFKNASFLRTQTFSSFLYSVSPVTIATSPFLVHIPSF